MPEPPAQLKLAIDGMHCQGCADRLARALGKLEGVEVRSVQLGAAELAYDPARRSSEEIRAAIAKLGFQAREA
jgi:copper chaperone CopZ